MVSRKWLSVLAVVAAMVACAAARPNGANDILPPNKNEISKEVHTKTEDPQLDTKKIEGSTLTGEKSSDPSTGTGIVVEAPAENKTEKNEVVAEAVTVTEVVAVTEATTATPVVNKPVNERFPHAVLFGGTCGGSIISPTWILSAGHCTLFSGGRYVLAGTNNTEDGSGVSKKVKRLVIHPRFSVGPYWLDADRFGIKQVAANWDFLLAELEEPLPLDGKTIAAVELDEGPTIPEGLEVGYGGYGAAVHGEVMREEMHGMDLQVVADSVCKEKMEQFEAEDMICTQGRPPRYDSACNGDSGSGLVANGKLYGVASWVEEDAHRCFPKALVVFSKVNAVRDWIRQVTNVQTVRS